VGDQFAGRFCGAWRADENSISFAFSVCPSADDRDRSRLAGEDDLSLVIRSSRARNGVVLRIFVVNVAVEVRARGAMRAASK